MKQKTVFRFLSAAVLAAGLLGGILLGGCSQEEETEPALTVVASTSLIEQIVLEVGGDKVDVVNIVPPASHPGDFDASPGDIRKLADADLFLWHNWPGEVYVSGLVESADNPDLEVIAIELEGNWMTPPVQRLAVDRIVEILSDADGANSAAYEEAGEAYKAVITARETEVRARLAKVDVSEVKVICAGWQAGFIGWAGFDIIGTYGLPTAPTIEQQKQLIDMGRADGVILVIDNVHNDPNAGKPIAEGIGCDRVVLLNFPGGYPDTETWVKAIDYNIDKLVDSLAD